MSKGSDEQEMKNASQKAKELLSAGLENYNEKNLMDSISNYIKTVQKMLKDQEESKSEVSRQHNTIYHLV